MKTILFIYGTRPEAIKMAPLIIEFKKYPELFNIKVCLTGQHRQMLDQINNFFEIKADYDLNIMSLNQTLFEITSRCLSGLKSILDQVIPDLIFVQGDTTSVMAGSLAGFYNRIPVAHLEAGLRTNNKYSPFPEEMNRILTSHIADFHFSPTSRAVENLKHENITNNVYLVGNTIIDALYMGLNNIKNETKKYEKYFSFLDMSKRIILVTGHRRENFGEGFDNICKSIAYIASKYDNIQFLYPVHFNPNVKKSVDEILKNIERVFLVDPLDYPQLLWIMDKCYFVLTDSGGIQEEAPALGKPVLVMREVTERQEGVNAGTARIVGTEYKCIVDSMQELLDDENSYKKMSNSINPYGDGTASKEIVKIIKSIL